MIRLSRDDIFLATEKYYNETFILGHYKVLKDFNFKELYKKYTRNKYREEMSFNEMKLFLKWLIAEEYIQHMPDVLEINSENLDGRIIFWSNKLW